MIENRENIIKRLINIKFSYLPERKKSVHQYKISIIIWIITQKDVKKNYL